MTKSIKKTELVSKKTKGERKKRLANEQKIAELKVHVQRVLKESDKYKEKIDKNEVRLLMKKGKKKITFKNFNLNYSTLYKSCSCLIFQY